jgi:hypothetical protein
MQLGATVLSNYGYLGVISVPIYLATLAYLVNIAEMSNI